MRFADNLHYMVLISFFIHVVFIGVSTFVLKKRHAFYVPSSYKVKIITPAEKNRAAKKKASRKTVAEKKSTVKKPAKKAKKAEPLLSKNDIRMLEKRIDSIKAKKKEEELETIIDISVKKVAERESETAGDVAGKEQVSVAGDTKGGGIMAEYINTIARQIRQEWVFPEILNNDYKTVVSIKIDRGGNIRILGIEESSNNALFDRSVLRAISKASPVKRPPYEMEIGLRFHP